jgi:hypothetical protein
VNTIVFKNYIKIHYPTNVNACLLRFFVELKCAKHHTVVGERDGRMPFGGGGFGESFGCGCTVQERVVGVGVDEVRHGGDFSFDYAIAIEHPQVQRQMMPFRRLPLYV